MSRTWLLLDMHFLAWRAFHTTGALTFGNIGTGVLYGVFRDLVNFTELHATPHVMFSFDRRPYLREKLLKTYKQRTPFDAAQEEQFAEVRRQIGLLRTKYLKELGYRNIYHQKGYEADDVIASFVHNLPKKDIAIIISSDRDLFQLLDHTRVLIWNPNSKKAFTEKTLEVEYGVTPQMWPKVKAMAGCHSDNVRGIVGVGEKTACKYVNGTMKVGCKAHQSLTANADTICKNLALVELPFPGIVDFIPKMDKIAKFRWRALLKRLGMETLIDRYPAGA